MACSFMATRGPGSAASALTSTRAPLKGRHFDGYLGGGIAGPCVGEGVQAVSRVVARLVDVDLPDLENVDLDLAVRGGQQY